jgi:MFS transporter, DHA2 family, multidrug resistance protein
MSTAAITISDDEKSAPAVNLYVSVFILTIATFMEVLDASIVNVAVPKISADLSASVSETSWVIGSYLVANAVILPISGWLASFFGRKRYYMACTFLFIVSSFLCGIATSLEALIFFRVLQGLSGGGLAPSEQAIIAETAPPDKIGRAFSIYGFGLAVAPVFGPTVGGWITDTFSWHWIFFINIPIGIVSLLLVHFFIRETKTEKEMRDRMQREKSAIDWQGIALLALGIGALQFFLEKGPVEDWFESDTVFLAAIVAFVALLLGIGWELTREKPAVDLRLFRHRNFSAACVLIFTVGAVTFGSIFLVPFMAQTLLGYSAMNAGMLGMAAAITLTIMIPIVGYLLDKTDPRLIILIGLVLSILALWHLTGINLEISFYELALARVFQSFALAFLAVSMNTVAYTGLAPEESNNASALLNLARNVGGSIGIALVTTMIAQRSQIHLEGSSAHLSNFNPNFVGSLEHLTQYLREQGLTAADAAVGAQSLLWQTAVKKASMSAILDTYYIFIFLSILLLPLVFLLKRKPSAENSAGH